MYFLIYMKCPREVGKDNELAEFLNSRQLLGNLTINEMVTIQK